MNKSVQYLLACIRLIVCKEPVVFPVLMDEEWKKLYTISCRQDLSHIVGLAIESDETKTSRETLAPELEKKFELQKNMAIYRYTNQEFAISEIGEAFEKNEILYLPLKGSVLRYAYPEAWMRTSSDIDILIQEKDYERAKEILKTQCRFEYESKNKKDASFFRDECVHLELHTNLVKDVSVKRLHPEYIWNYVERDGFACRMQDEDFYLYHIEHMKNHYLTGGCGIRFFTDLWVLNHLIKYDVKKRTEVLAESRRLKFEQNTRYLLEVWFEGAAHTDLTRKMEQFILSAGVYGTIENWALIQEVRQSGKIQSVWKRLWLPYESLCWTYPELEGRRWLQPYYEWKRFARMIAEGRWSRSVTELKANRTVSKTEKKKIKQMLEELGL